MIRVGGLGDVLGSLPAALRELGVDARVCAPAHAGALDRATEARSIERFGIDHSSGPMQAEVFETTLEGVPLYLIAGPPIPRDGIVYTGRMDEEGRRFTFFALAALELARRLEVDVLHAHDWHTAVSTWMLARQRDADPALRDMRSLLTVHNLPYAGYGTELELGAFGIPMSDHPALAPHQRHLPLALGLARADALSTVSPGYRREILGADHGQGFDALLRSRRDVLTGILNGLDVTSWNPATDAELAAPYDAANRAGRDECRRALREELGLPDDGVPLIAMVSRLVAQKGIDVALGALRRLERPHHAVILGSGEPHLEHEIRAYAAERPGTVRAFVGFDGPLSRRIYAGADLMLIPSRYEPCGMTQLIAMRYGCVPVAAETGGLADTVLDLDLSDAPTGVLFPEPREASASFGLRRALGAWDRPDVFDAVIANGMKTDFSWARSARAYMDIYKGLGS